MNLKDELVKIGSQNPRLQKHLKPVLDHLERTASFKAIKSAWRLSKENYDHIMSRVPMVLNEQESKKGPNSCSLKFEHESKPGSVILQFKDHGDKLEAEVIEGMSPVPHWSETWRKNEEGRIPAFYEVVIEPALAEAGAALGDVVSGR